MEEEGLRGPLSNSSGAGRGQSSQPSFVFSGTSRGYRGQSRGQSKSQRFRGKSNTKLFTYLFSSRNTSSLPVSSGSSLDNDSVQQDTKCTTSRQAGTLSKQLEKVNLRFDYNRLCTGISDSIQRQHRTRSISEFQALKNVSGRVIDCEQRNFRNVKKGCNQESSTSTRAISQHNFSCGQKGRGSSSSGEPEEPQHPCSLYSFQNGGTAFDKRTPPKERLLIKTGSKGRLLLCSPKAELSKVCEIRMGRNPLRVPVSLLRVKSCPARFHKTNESANGTSTKTECKIDYLLGRHPSDGSKSAGSRGSTRLTNLFTPKLGLLNKYTEISLNTNTPDKVFRNADRFSNDGSVSPTAKSRQDNRPMSRADRIQTGIRETIGQGDRQTIFDSTSCPTSSSELPIFTKAAISGPRYDGFFQYNSKPITVSSNGTELVDRKSKALQWKVPVRLSTRTLDNIRCVPEGLGCILSKQLNRRSLDSRGKDPAYKCLRTESGLSSHKNFHFQKESVSNSYPDGQYSCSEISGKNGGNTKSPSDKASKRNLLNRGDHNYSRVPPREIKCCSGQGIPGHPGLKRMETAPPGISLYRSTVRDASNRSVCVKSFPPSLMLHVLENGPFQSRQGRFPTQLEKGTSLCFSSILAGRKSSQKGQEGPGMHDIDRPSMANSILVSSSLRIVCSESNTITKSTKSFTRPSRKIPPIDKTKISNFSGLECLRKDLEAKGVSARAATLISDARRPGTASHYQSAWGKWAGWCNKREIDPVRCEVNWILNYLAEKFDQGLEYSTIAGYRSAISAYHIGIDGSKVGDNPQVSSLLTGIYNRRPPKPRYTFIWDANVVVDYIKALPDDNDLTLKMLSWKLTTLLALTAASRASEISYLDLQFLQRHSSGYTFHIAKNTKICKPGKPRPVLTFQRFSESPKICVCTVIENYIIRTSLLRNEENLLLISHVKPHKAVKSCTISKWIVGMLGLSGIDTSTFKAHSTRAASTSKASDLGVPLSEIVKRGRWTNSSTFENFYKKPSNKTGDFNFESAVLTGKL